jgi:threonine/homoserine/homoserine lactone efflux protein
MVVAVAAFSVAAALIVLLPGPGTLVVLRELVREGRARAMQTVLLAVATPVTRWLADVRIRRRMDAAAGLVLIGLGTRLAIEP